MVDGTATTTAAAAAAAATVAEETREARLVEQISAALARQISKTQREIDVLTEQSAQTEPSFTEPFYGALFYGASFTKPSFTEPSFTEPSSRDVADALFQAVQELSLASAEASTTASGDRSARNGNPSVFAEPSPRAFSRSLGRGAFLRSFFAEP